MPVAGGTDVIVEMRGNPSPGMTLIDLSLLREMKGIGEQGDVIWVGALSTHEEAAGSVLLRREAAALSMACGEVGSLQIRNRGTLGGNVANASPCADGLTALVGLGARARLVSHSNGEREVLVEDLIERPYRTGISDDELILGFLVPRAGTSTRSHFVKLGRRNALAISRINATCAMDVREGKVFGCMLAVGSVMPRTQRVREAEDSLNGGALDDIAARRAGDVVAERMIEVSGVRWSTPYKDPVVRAIVRRVVYGAMGLDGY